MDINNISKLYGESVIKTFNEKYHKFDIVDRSYLEKSLLTKSVQDFYFSVGLRFIAEYLECITKERRNAK